MIEHSRMQQIGRKMGLPNTSNKSTEDSKIWLEWWCAGKKYSNFHSMFHGWSILGFTLIRLSFIYAKCSITDRPLLWDEWKIIAVSSNDAWFMGGYFHILAETHEKLGGRPPENNAMLEFQEMIRAPLRNGACFIVDIKAANTRGVITNLGITLSGPVLIEQW